jgi:hypothetical protein
MLLDHEKNTLLLYDLTQCSFPIKQQTNSNAKANNAASSRGHQSNWPKINFLLFPLKVVWGICTGLIRRFPKFQKNILTWKVLLGRFHGVGASACYLYVIYPKNETLHPVNLVPPKAWILEVLVWVMSPESVVKFFGPLCESGVC